MSENNKIPKVIHYCWLSGDPFPTDIQECIDSWKEHMPDYELVCWDMNKFDVNSVPFVKTACEQRKWAFAADYIRLHALYHHGGIYLDSDVIVHKRFDPFLLHSAFSGMQVNPHIMERQIREGSDEVLGIEPAIIGSEKGHPWIKRILDYYKDKKYENTISFHWKNVMTRVVADISAADYGFQFMPIYQVLKDDVHIYPPDVFTIHTPVSVVKYSTHLCANTWVDHTKISYTFSEKMKIFILEKVIGKNNWKKIKRYIRK